MDWLEEIGGFENGAWWAGGRVGCAMNGHARLEGGGRDWRGR